MQRFGLLVFQYAGSGETIDIDYVRTRKPDGTVTITPPENIQDMSADITRAAPFYSDQREKHVAVKGLGPGDILEYRIRWKDTKPLIPGQFYFDYNFADAAISLHEQLEISMPADRAVKWKSPEIKPEITTKGPRQIFRWTYANLSQKTTKQREKEQDQATYWTIRGRFPQADVQISSFQSWEEIGRWYGSLQQDRVQPTPEIRAKAEELTKGSANEDAKIRAIYDYVSSRFRYIGINFGVGRFQPHTAAEVLSNQYGDCKDKHTLLAALLQAAGIAAFPALISTHNEVDLDTPSPNQFNHVITAVPRGKDYLWLDSTGELAPIGYLVPPLRDKRALVIAADQPIFVTTPAEPPFAISSVLKVKGKLSESGVLDASMDQSVRNDLEVLLRTMFRRVPETHWQELVQQLSSNAGFGGTVSNVTAVSPEATDTPFHFSYSYNRKDYSDWENRRITPPFPPIMLPGLRDDQAALEEPLWLGAPGQSVLEAAVEMPRGYRPELPPAVDVERDFAEYHASYAFKDGVLSAERRLVIKTREVQVTELAEYKSFRKAIDDDQQRYIVLASEGQSPARTSPASIGALAWQLPDSQNPSAIHAEQIARSDVMQQDLNGAISSMQAAVEADPKFVRGWVLLGTLHMTSGDTDAGLRALRTAVDRDPQNFIPRKMLGFGFMGANRPDEAIEVWRELLKIAPQDYDAVANLSELLLRAKRYTEAIPVLESSLKANPQDLPMWLSLGSAYLRSGKEEQGVAAFESALKLKPGAEVENDFGYELAEANVRLTDALRLAQKAVGTEEDESSKVRLSALKQEDLLHPSILAAYWDTLGWVYFKMAKLPESEQYLSAAWELSQSATTADHLSQVYEREHKVEAAGRMHRLAAAAGFHPLRSEGQPLRLRRGTPQPLVEGGAELSQMRTTRLGRILPGTATAEFFLMFAPGPKVQEVKFISGSEKARAAEKILISTHFRVVFPDGSNARLLRRGILACYPTSACSFVLFPVSQVRSLN